MNKFFDAGSYLLKNLFLSRGNHFKLVESFQYISEHKKQTYGVLDDEYRISQYHLANCFLSTTQFDKAYKIIEKTAKLQCKWIDPINDEFHAWKNHLALCLKNNNEKAIQILNEVERVGIETLGETHESYLTTKHNIACCYQNQGEYETAIQLFKEVERVRIQTLGETHKDYSKIDICLVKCYEEMFDCIIINASDIEDDEVSCFSQSEWYEITMDMVKV